MKIDKENKGLIFANTLKEKENQPDYNGYLNIGGKQYKLAAWKNTSQKDGKMYLSCSIEENKEEDQQQQNNFENKSMSEQGVELQEVSPF